MTWLKSIKSGFAVVVLALLAFLASNQVRRHKASARQWQDRAISEGESDVANSAEKAKQALSQAKLHKAKAKEATAKTKARLDAIEKHNPTMADITSKWHKPKS